MFGLSSLGLKIAIGAIILAAMTSGVFYVQKLQADLKLAAEENARLEDSIRAKDAAMAQIRRDLENMAKIQTELNEQLRAAEEATTELAKRFNVNPNGKERNIGLIAGEKPELIESRINRATRDALRCNELVTGAQLTNDEKNKKVRNSICPELLP
jgi:septal ring factor EnvC (AmiA/AmiB activator)